MAKLTADAVRQIRSSRGTASLAATAHRFGVTPQCVDQVLKNKTWQHVA
jgi:hypothetical protein